MRTPMTRSRSVSILLLAVAYAPALLAKTPVEDHGCVAPEKSLLEAAKGKLGVDFEAAAAVKELVDLSLKKKLDPKVTKVIGRAEDHVRVLVYSACLAE